MKYRQLPLIPTLGLLDDFLRIACQCSNRHCLTTDCRKLPMRLHRTQLFLRNLFCSKNQTTHAYTITGLRYTLSPQLLQTSQLRAHYSIPVCSKWLNKHIYKNMHTLKKQQYLFNAEPYQFVNMNFKLIVDYKKKSLKISLKTVDRHQKYSSSI